MSDLTLVPLASAPAVADPKGLERKREAEWREAIDSVYSGLCNTMGQAATSEWVYQLYRYPQFLKGRIATRERTLRRVLSADVLGEADRQKVLATLYGNSGPARDGKTLDPVEVRLIEQYRTLDDATRQMLRTLVERLAQLKAHEDGE